MKSILLITFIDFGREENQRPHHLARYFGSRHQQLVVLSRAANSSDARRIEDIRSLFRFRTQVDRHGERVEVRVTPPLNYRPGFGRRLLRREEGGGEGSRGGGRGSVSSILRRLGQVRHFMVAPAMLAGFLLAGGGKYDICMVQGAWEGVVGVLLRKLRRVRLLVYEDIDYWGGEGETTFEHILQAAERFSVNQADLRISTGELLGDLRRKQVGKEVHVITNGVDVSLFHGAQKKEAHQPTLVYMGNVIEWSGVELAISALPIILKEVSDVRLLVIGKGDPDYLATLRKQAVYESVEERVVFTGLRPYQELPTLLRKTDIGLACFQPISYLKYAFPLKVAEYMAAGLPVIGTANTETERILTRGPSGMAVAYRKEPFARAAITLLTDRELYERYVQNAVRESRQFEWNLLLEREYELVDRAYCRLYGGVL